MTPVFTKPNIRDTEVKQYFPWSQPNSCRVPAVAAFKTAHTVTFFSFGLPS